MTSSQEKEYEFGSNAQDDPHRHGAHGGQSHDHGKDAPNVDHNSHEAHDRHTDHRSSTSGRDRRGHHARMVKDMQRRFFISLTLSVPIVLMAPLLLRFFNLEKGFSFEGQEYVLFTLSSAVFFYGGWPFLRGFIDELGNKQPGMMTLISVAIITAYGYSSLVVFGLQGKTFFWELATLIDIMLLGHWIEMRSVMGASGALDELAKMIPAEAHLMSSDGETKDVAVDHLHRNDRVMVKPGEKIPLDGVVIEGHSNVNEAMISGESRPVEKGPDDEVVGGAINGETSLIVEVKKIGDETYLSHVVEMVRKAQESRSKTQDLADRAASWL